MINDIISIKAMNDIFAKANCKVSAETKMLYQNVLNHWFSNLPQEIVSLAKFEMFKKDIKYKSFEKGFISLEKAGLITTSEFKICFLDVWVEHIPTHLLNKEKYETITANDVKDEMYQSHALSEIVRMKYRVTIKQANDLLTLFLSEQLAIATTYHNEGQVRKHFIYWCQSNINKTQNEQVKSKGKILGKK
jgi:hypothetical protein